MKITITTENVVTALKFKAVILAREQFKLTQNTAYLNDFSAYGAGSTISGRDVNFHASFTQGDGSASLQINAPESSGGFLATVLEEIIGECRVSGKGDVDDNDARLHILREVEPMVVEIDGVIAGPSWERIEAANGWIDWIRMVPINS